VTDADSILEQAGFDPEESVLTRRQAEVLALRERGLTQSTIAEEFGTSRANVASIESSARENVRKARETVAVAEALRAPVQVEISAGTDLYDVPPAVFEACDEADVKVPHTAPELLSNVGEASGDAVVGREVRMDILLSVGTDGSVRVRRRSSE
jgi:Tfx family DNA-binding protein